MDQLPLIVLSPYPGMLLAIQNLEETAGPMENDCGKIWGIKVTKTKIVCYMISGFTAALAGILLMARLGRHEYDHGNQF